MLNVLSEVTKLLYPSSCIVVRISVISSYVETVCDLLDNIPVVISEPIKSTFVGVSSYSILLSSPSKLLSIK